MPETMLAVMKVNPGPGLSLVEAPIPQAGPDDVLIRVTASSICGTDVHIYDWDVWSQHRIKPPLILGHEFAGEIVECGADVRDFRVGDFVSAEGHILGKGSHHVHPGQEHLAPGVEVIGIDRPGAFAEYVAVPARNVWHNPPDLAPELASLQDPFGNAVHTVFAQDVTGKTVLVTGAGPIGLMTVPVAKAVGARAVYITDINPRKLDLARRLGVDEAFNATDPDLIQRIRDLTDGEGVDVLLEMSGHETAIAQGFSALRPGGEAALLGLPSRDIRVNWGEHIVLKGATVRGIYGRRIWDTWYRMRALLGTGAVDLWPLITHRFALAEFDSGFQAMKSTNEMVGKVILYPPGSN
ncbi:MAG: L-threonine 3-dehydrogenase [Anaerolineae bacterium]